MLGLHQARLRWLGLGLVLLHLPAGVITPASCGSYLPRWSSGSEAVVVQLILVEVEGQPRDEELEVEEKS